MLAFVLFTVALVLTGRGWLAVFESLRADLRAAGPDETERARVPAAARVALISDDATVPLQRVLAFRGVARRVAARRRWEAGFGRRGL